MIALGKMIAAKREQLGLTQADLGAVLGVVRQTIAKWERTGKIPDEIADFIFDFLAQEQPMIEVFFLQVADDRGTRPLTGLFYRELEHAKRQLKVLAKDWRQTANYLDLDLNSPHGKLQIVSADGHWREYSIVRLGAAIGDGDTALECR